MDTFVLVMVVLGVTGIMSFILLLFINIAGEFRKREDVSRCPYCSEEMKKPSLGFSSTVRCKCGARATYTLGSLMDWELQDTMESPVTSLSNR